MPTDRDRAIITKRKFLNDLHPTFLPHLTREYYLEDKIWDGRPTEIIKFVIQGPSYWIDAVEFFIADEKKGCPTVQVVEPNLFFLLVAGM